MPPYLDKTARALFNEGLQAFHGLGLKDKAMFEIGQTIYILPWLGDRATNAITAFLCQEGIKANCSNGIIDIHDCPKENLLSVIISIVKKPQLTAQQLATNVLDTVVEKHDPLVPHGLRSLDYGGKFFDAEKAWDWLLKLPAQFAALPESPYLPY